MLPKFAYVRPDNLKEAVEKLSAEGAMVHAGGTDLLGCLRDDVLDAGTLVSISAIKDLRGIRKTENGGLRIGALTTITEVSRHRLVNQKYKGLAQGASEVASPQLRNQGTIGGNLCQKPRCWYYRGEFHCLRKGGTECFAAEGENTFHCIFGSDSICFIVHPSDTAPNLAALDAEVNITGPKGKRTVKVEDFHVLPADDVMRDTVLAPGEIVTEIIVPPVKHGLRSSYRKIKARRSWDFALAGVALALVFDGDKVTDGRVVFSGAAPVPWRSREVESAIIGNILDGKTIRTAAEASVKGAEPLAKNEYKIGMFQGMMTEELEKIARAEE